ncbi:ankyrin repeat domain-containing protein 11-like [Vigna unguiculata]|uniref:ankyrin repeat domain-containing protein 11-like n=1 Tax=Vigna unguiculata TaxID=3917 RepID=UPI0010160AF4|nr:ankyrin repeat domain-containing protein 11-like [Vigna unguiculata]
MATHNTNVVYIDTNLDTRFALLVAYDDTVADLKRSILLEHPSCFPQIGQIQINGIKVEREGHFYHLVDSMPVRSAFTGTLKSWLVSVDATVVRECSRNYQVATLGIVSNALTGRGDNGICSPSKGVSTFGNFNLQQLEKKPVENAEVPVRSPCVSQHSGKGAAEKLDTGVKSSVENNDLPGSAMEYEVDGTNKSIEGVCVVRKERNSKSVSDLSRKRKGKRKKEDAFRDDTLNVGDASVVGLGDCAIQQDIEVVAKTLENANKEVIMEIDVLKEHMHTDCNNSNTKNDINTAVSLQEASEPELSADKKHKKRKRSLSDDSKEIFKEETAAQKDEAHKSDEAHEERKELKDQFELKNENYRYGVEYKDDKVTGDILDAETPTKKKRKSSKEKSRDKSLPRAKLINDFNVDISSHHDLEDLQKIKNSNDDQSSAEKFSDNDTLRTILGRRRKGKKNSSNPHETPLITSSRNVEEEDHSSIQRGDQEEISLSKDMTMGKTTIDNMETGTDACKEDIQTTEKTTGNYNNHSDIEIIEHPANVVDHMELTEDNDKNEAGQIKGAEEGRELSPQNNPKLMVLDKSTPSNQDNSDAKVGELNVTSKVVDVNGTTESRKSKKEKKKKKKDKNSGGDSPFKEGIQHVDASESKTVIMKSLGATNCDPKSGNTETEENPLNQIGGKIQQEEMHGTSDKEIDFNIESAEHTGKRQRKKSNDKQSSISKSMSNMLLKDQGDSKNSPSSSDRETQAKSSVAVTKKLNSASTKSSKKSCKTNTEPEKDSVQLEPSDAVQLSTQSTGEKDDDNLEAPSKTLKVNADEQFLSRKQPGEANLSDVMLVDKLNETEMKAIETMTRNKIHQIESTNGQTHAKDLSSSLKLSSKEELDVRIHPGEKVPNAHRSGQDSKVSGNRTVIEENKKTRVKASEKKMDLEKQRKHVPVSNSKLEGSTKRIQSKAGKASGNNVRGVVGKTPQKKSLLSGAIFKDDSSSSSSSDNEVGNSGASTRTPSDNPLLSDGDSSSGSYGGQSPENGGRSSSKASLTETKGMSIDDVLRSSSWFKKAKIIASESQSQEFVPDSLAD